LINPVEIAVGTAWLQPRGADADTAHEMRYRAGWIREIRETPDLRAGLDGRLSRELG